MRNTILFALLILAVVGVLYLISGDKAPQIPRDDRHAAAVSEQDCLACHGEGMSHPKTERHPPKDQCFICHKRSRKASAR